MGCLVASDLDTCEEMTLLVDIGTNGELVLGNRERADRLFYSGRTSL